MSLTIDRSFFYRILFMACIGLPYLNIYELTFAVWAFAATVTIAQRYSVGILKQVGIFTLLLALAFVVMLFKDYEAYFIIRDITYMLKPILGLMIGYQVCRRNFENAFRMMVDTGVGISVIHLVVIAWAVLFMGAASVNDIRFFGGYFSDYEIYTLILLIFHKRFELEYSQKKFILLTAIVALSSFLYLARTNFLQFIILFLALKGFLSINRRSVTVVAVLSVMAALGYSAILYINPKRNGKGIEALLYKIKIAPTEPFKTTIKRDDWRDFNDNYRSYENIMTVRQMTSDGTATFLFGKGLGSKVDLRQKVWLGDMELRFISILHNGFMTVFLKTGLIGVLIYLVSIGLLFKKSRSEIPIVCEIDLLLVGTGVFLILSNWVFMGVYNLLDNKSIIIGLLLCYREMKVKQTIAHD